MSAETSTTENKGSTPLNQEAIDKLSPEDRETYDAAQAEREQAEQAALPYAWSQKLDQVTVNVPVPEGTRAKQLNIAIKRTHLTVGFKGQEPIVDGDLPGPIREDESFWTLEDSKLISIVLDKIDRSGWWAHVLTKDPKIDTKKIVPEESSLSDLGGEERAVVEKMIWEQRMKAMGKDPQADQKQAAAAAGGLPPELLEQLAQAQAGEGEGSGLPDNIDWSKVQFK